MSNNSIKTAGNIYVYAIGISDALIDMKIGETANISAIVSPSNATNKRITWSSSNTAVATVMGRLNTGIIAAKGAGTATITVAAQDGSGVKATCKVTVTKNIHDTYFDKLQSLFGFSYEEAHLIRTLYEKIDNLFPLENYMQKAWRCARLLSEFSYDSFSFNDVAGSLTNQENRKAYFMSSLGYTESEYNTLKSALIDNHNDTNVIDFTHLQYSLAARLAYTLNEDDDWSNLGTQIYTGNWGIYSDEDISYLGGWLGDAVLSNFYGAGQPAMKNDDYMADLDAENIYRLIMQGNSSIDAINSYYSNMNASNTRANIFLQYIPYSTVKQKIFYELIDADLYVYMTNASNQGDIYMTRYWLNLINDEQYHFNEIKSRYPDTYDFLMSLNDRLLTMAHYE